MVALNPMKNNTPFIPGYTKVFHVGYKQNRTVVMHMVIYGAYVITIDNTKCIC